MTDSEIQLRLPPSGCQLRRRGPLGEGQGHTVVLRLARIVLGRHPDCDLRFTDPRGDLRFTDPRVSRQHAELYRVGDLWWVRDLGSVGGTRLDGEVVEVAPLQATATVQLGAGGPTLEITGGRLESPTPGPALAAAVFKVLRGRSGLVHRACSWGARRLR